MVTPNLKQIGYVVASFLSNKMYHVKWSMFKSYKNVTPDMFTPSIAKRCGDDPWKDVCGMENMCYLLHGGHNTSYMQDLMDIHQVVKIGISDCHCFLSHSNLYVV
jgi:hypothetical protein